MREGRGNHAFGVSVRKANGAGGGEALRILHRGNKDVFGVGMLRIQCRRRQKERERSYMLLVRT